MDRSFALVIACTSQSQTLHAGEFPASGTGGRCCGLERGHGVEPGLEGIGVPRTRIVESETTS